MHLHAAKASAQEPLDSAFFALPERPLITAADARSTRLKLRLESWNLHSRASLVANCQCKCIILIRNSRSCEPADRQSKREELKLKFNVKKTPTPTSCGGGRRSCDWLQQLNGLLLSLPLPLLLLLLLQWDRNCAVAAAAASAASAAPS